MSQADTQKTQNGESRALVVITTRDEASRTSPARKPNAAFLAQIMASKAHMGEFRRYRRSEPSVAAARYNAAAALIDGPKGLRLNA
ncbi:MAG: hypothetical protein ACRCWO_01070 [Bosea sp. (in: a-proteobacteria)]